MKGNRPLKRRNTVLLLIMCIMMLVVGGCANFPNTDEKEISRDENTIITETGEILEKPEEEAPAEATPEATPDIIMLTEPLEEPEITAEPIAEEVEVEVEDPNALQIVFLGDSIFDASRDGTGVPYLVGEACGANIYNLAIGGTSASVEEGEAQEYEKWTSRSFVGVVLMMAGKVNDWPIEGSRAHDVMQTMDVSKTDYFVIEYGLNDFFRGVPLDNPDRSVDMTTYVGALRVGISQLKELVPTATIVLCSPHYCQFFDDDTYIGDGNILHNGQGTLFDYKGSCQYVANESGSIFVDNYLDLGIDGYTASDYLEDGVHLNSSGRRLYADFLARQILKYEETINN